MFRRRSGQDQFFARANNRHVPEAPVRALTDQRYHELMSQLQQMFVESGGLAEQGADANGLPCPSPAQDFEARAAKAEPGVVIRQLPVARLPVVEVRKKETLTLHSKSSESRVRQIADLQRSLAIKEIKSNMLIYGIGLEALAGPL